MRLDPQKRPWLDSLFSAMDELQDGQCAVNLILAGGGKLLSEYEAKAQAINGFWGKEIVKIFGAVHRAEDIVKIYRGADVIVGHGRGIMEAMSCGKLAIILGEEGQASLITPENLECIAHYNFSGRHFKVPGEQGEPIVSVLRKIADFAFAPRLQELRQFCCEYIRKHYDAHVGADKLVRVFATAFAEGRTTAVRSGICRWVLCRSLARGLAPFRPDKQD